MDFKTSSVIKKLDKPVLTRFDVPYEAALVFNAGITKYNGKYVMIFRNDYGSYEEQKLKGTNLGLATSDDGINWTVAPKPCFALESDEIKRVYDPRLTVIDGVLYLCFAVDTKHGVCGGMAKTEDLEHFEVLSISVPENRNMVLFPEKINGMFCRLERPMPVYGRGGKDRFDTWLSYSPDMRYWGDSSLVFAVEDIPFANDKVGPGAPPIKTDKGWLCFFHAVWRDDTRGKNGWEEKWRKQYTAGVMLLDLNDPSKVLGYSKEPLIASDRDYELDPRHFRTHVIFPGGAILEDNGEVKIYYGGGDSVECLATANVDDLIKLCLEK